MESNVPDALFFLGRNALRERQHEIEKLMLALEKKKFALAERISTDRVDWLDARLRNSKMDGLLGELWSVFLELRKTEQIGALKLSDFNGMAWQSLMQCNPIQK